MSKSTPATANPDATTARAVERSCEYLSRHLGKAVPLAELAQHVGLSPYHLQRTFTRQLGISPKAYQTALRAGRFRRGLREGAPVVGAQYDAGYGSSRGVYEGRPTGRGMTPATYRRGGQGATIAYTTVGSPLGRLLVAGTPRGVCAVKLGDVDAALVDDLRAEYPAAEIVRDQSELTEWVATLLDHLGGRVPRLDLPVDVQATAFQWKVWRYLQSIPYGETRAYSEVAEAIGSPTAARAVARACATNRVCLVIPCHRVVQRDGGLGGYRWGVERKRRLISDEDRQRGGRHQTGSSSLGPLAKGSR